MTRDCQSILRILAGLLLNKGLDLIFDRYPANIIPAMHGTAAALRKSVKRSLRIIGVELHVLVTACAPESSDNFLMTIVSKDPSIDIHFGIVNLSHCVDCRWDVAQVSIGSLGDSGHLD